MVPSLPMSPPVPPPPVSAAVAVGPPAAVVDDRTAVVAGSSPGSTPTVAGGPVAVPGSLTGAEAEGSSTARTMIRLVADSFGVQDTSVSTSVSVGPTTSYCVGGTTRISLTR